MDGTMQFNPKHFQRLDVKCFKAFIAAAETENFTSAADLAAMTQSGISQNIKKLEEQLGHPLFKRVDKNVTLTSTGHILVGYVKSYLDGMECFFEDILQDQELIEGKVCYTMPPSCSMSPHFPMLLKKRLEYPGIELQIHLAPNNEVFERILSGKSDFGFVTEKVLNQSLVYQPFCQEKYVLTYNNQVDHISPQKLLEYKWIRYPGVEIYFDFWAKHFLPEIKNIDHRSLSYAGEINSIEGAREMVAGGLGISIFPTHTIADYVEQEKLFCYEPEDYEPLLNTIYIITHANHKQPKRVQRVIDWFTEMHPEAANLE